MATELNLTDLRLIANNLQFLQESSGKPSLERVQLEKVLRMIEEREANPNFDEFEKTKVRYSQYTLRQWQIIATAVRHMAATHHGVIEREKVTAFEFEEILATFPSVVL